MRHILAGSVFALLCGVSQSIATVDVFNPVYDTNGGSWGVTPEWSLNRRPMSGESVLVNFIWVNPNLYGSSVWVDNNNNPVSIQTISFAGSSGWPGNPASFYFNASNYGVTGFDNSIQLTGGTNAFGTTDLIYTTTSLTIGGYYQGRPVGIAAGASSLTINFGSVNAGIYVDTAQTLLIDGTIEGPAGAHDVVISGTNGLTKNGAGVLSIFNLSSTYTGVTTINAGTVSVKDLENGGNASDMGASSNAAGNLVLNGGTLQYTGSGSSTDRRFTLGANGGTLDASGSGSLTLAGNTASGANTVAYTTANTATTLTLTGTGAGNLGIAITNNGTAATALTKTGSGTWTLNTPESYSGTTTVSQGTLVLDGTNGSVLGPNSTINVSANATLQLIGNQYNAFLTPAQITVSAGGTINVAGSAPNSCTLGNTLLQGGRLTSSAITDPMAGNIVLNNNATLTANGDVASTIDAVVFEYGNGTTFSVGTGTGGAPSLLTIASSIHNYANTTAYPLNKSGAGTLVLSGTNTFTGAVNINAGTLQLGSGGTTGVLTTSSTITDNGTLAFNRSNAVTQGTDFSGAALTGSGGLTQAGTGTLTLNAANTYTGPTNINAGTLQISGSIYGTTGAGAITVNSGGTLSLVRNDTFGNSTVTPLSTVTINAGGTVSNAGAFFTTFNNLTLNGGTLVDNGGANSNFQAYQLKGTVTAGAGASAITLGASPTNSLTAIQLGNNLAGGITTFAVTTAAASLTIAPALVDGVNSSGTATVSSGLTKTGPGTLILSAINTYHGATNVTGGALLVSGSLSGTASVTVGDGTNGATLGGNGSIIVPSGGTLTIKNAATLAPSIGNASGLTLGRASGTASVAFQTGSTFQLSMANSQVGTLGAPSLNDYSKLTIGTGVSVTLGGNIVTTFDGGMNNGDLFTIILNGGTFTGTFANTPTAAPNSAGSTFRFSSNGLLWDINYAWTGSTALAGQDPTAFEQTTGGHNVALLLVQVPEPGAWVSLLGGCAMLLGWRRCRARVLTRRA